mgnify:FL=1
MHVNDDLLRAEAPQAKRQMIETSMPTSIDSSSKDLPMSMVCSRKFLFLFCFMFSILPLPFIRHSNVCMKCL